MRQTIALVLALMVVGTLQAQTYTKVPDPICASGGTAVIRNPDLAMNATFEEIPSGSPATVSVTVQGCGRGGTCDTAADTNTSTSTALRGISFTKTYDHFLVTASWTGGSAVCVAISPYITTARNGATIPASFSFDLPSPSVGDSALYEHKLQSPGQITRVSCSTDQGTASINLDLRQESTPNTSGTAVLGSALVCNSNTAITTTLANPVYSANAPVALLISGTSGTPSVVRVHVASVVTQ